MPEIVVDNLHGLNEKIGQATPEEAIVAENIDPFRGDVGAIAPIFQFDKIDASWPDTHDRDEKIVCGINFAGEVLVSTLKTDDEFQHPEVHLYHLTKNEDGELEWQLVPFDQTLGWDYNFIPKRYVVDPHEYSWSAGQQTIKYRQLYLFGWAINQGGQGANAFPHRIIRAEKSNGDILWWHGKMNIYTHHSSWSGGIGYEQKFAGQGDFNKQYFYYFIFEDIAGNLLQHRRGHVYTVRCANLGYKYIEWTISLNSDAIKQFGLKKVHVYRETAPYVDAPYGEDGTKLQWRATLNVYFPGTGTLTWRDVHPGDKTPTGQAVLGDLLEYTISQNQDCFNNVDKSEQGVVGLWSDRVVFSHDNEIMWSATALNTPYGSRFLMYPSINTWSFQHIHKITDLLEQRDNLVALSGDGIAVLYGDNLSNMYDEKVSDVATAFTPLAIGGRLWWDWTVVNFDAHILLVDSVGRPRIFDGREARLMTDNLIIPRKKEQGDAFGLYDLDAVRYRNGYLITNGEKIYVWAKEGNRWVTWLSGSACKRFLRPNSAWLSKEFSGEEIPIVYDSGGGLPEPDAQRGAHRDLLRPGHPPIMESMNRSFLYTLDENANLWSYGTREDKHLVNMRWVTDKIPVEVESLFHLLILKWRYLPYLGYEKYDLEEVPEEYPTIHLWIYADDQDMKNQDEYIEYMNVPLTDRKKPGTYEEKFAFSVRAKRIGYQLVVPSGRFFQLNGFELRYNPRGQRTYGS